MNRLSEILILTLMHSIWQSGLLCLFMYFCTPVLKKFTPLIRRNFLLLFIPVQLLASLVTVIQLSGLHGEGFGLIRHPDVETILIPALTDLIMFAYVLVAGYKLISLAVRYHRLPQRLSADISKAPVELRLFASLRAEEWGIKRKVGVFVSTHITSPLTHGFLKPVILIPASLVTGLHARQLEAIVTHELTHIKNLDYLFNMILLITESLYFFNPFFFRLTSAIRLEQEKECDRAVVNSKHDAVFYAETLLSVAAYRQNKLITVQAFSGSGSQLRKRIQFITGGNPQKLSARRYIIPLLLIPVICIIMGGSLFQLPGKPGNHAGLRGKYNELINRKVVVALTSPIPEVKSNPGKNNSGPAAVKLKKTGLVAIPAKSKENGSSEDINMQPTASVGYVSRASVLEPLETRQVILTEEISGGRTVTYSYTFTHYPEKWDYRLDSVRVEELQTSDSVLVGENRDAQ